MENRPEKSRASEMVQLLRLDCRSCGVFLGEVKENQLDDLKESHEQVNKHKPIHTYLKTWGRYQLNPS